MGSLPRVRSVPIPCEVKGALYADDLAQLIEHIISTHPAKDTLHKKAKEEGKNIYTGMPNIPKSG